MNIVLIGMKNCGKTTFANELANELGYTIISLDSVIEEVCEKISNEKLTFREIAKKLGNESFRAIESAVLEIIRKNNLDNCILDVGGGAPLEKENQVVLKAFGKIVYLDLDEATNFERIMKNGVPPFFPYPDDPKKSFEELIEKRRPIYDELADITLSYTDESPQELLQKYLSYN